MIEFSKEIEQCLKTLRNTNNKEQNFQGILFHHFMTKFGDTYEVEMETSRDDEHVKDHLIPTVDTNGNLINYRKKEIDLLVYNKNHKDEKYAAELKWVYHRNGTGGWNCLDMLGPFGDDAFFVDQLKEYAGFTETCSVVIYDFNEQTSVKRVVYGENENVKRAFLGGEFDEDRKKGVLMVEDKSYPFVWHDNMVNIEKGQKNKYYIIRFK